MKNRPQPLAKPQTDPRNPTLEASSEWSGARGEKWLAQLSGMEGMLRPVDAPLLDALQLTAPCRIADIGCGGGGTTLKILRRAPAGSTVHGFDISPALVASARSRANAADNVAFPTANMATAAPPGAPYDRLTSRFGVMFFDDPSAAFANLLRWLVPGGRFAFAVWGPPADNLWMTRLREVIAEYVDLPAIDPQAPGPFRYAEAKKMVALLEQAGFGAIHHATWRDALPIGGGLAAAEAANFALASLSSFGKLLAEAGDDVCRQACAALTSQFLQHEKGNMVQLEACVHIVTGTRHP